jgi:hypothetical protein
MSLVANQVKHGEPIAISDNRFAVDQKRVGVQCRDGGDNEWKARAEIVAVPRDEPDTRANTARHDAKAVMLNFVYPAWGRRGAFEGDRRHSPMIPSPGRVRSRNDIRA